MIITTTNNVEDHEIAKYLKPINSSVVIGSNIFSDIGASFVDLFGGRSSTYENKLRSIHRQAIDLLEIEAIKVKADAIIGVKIDMDEISGGGKQMFMVTVTGTPVKFLTKKTVIGNDEKLLDGGVIRDKVDLQKIYDKGLKIHDLKIEHIYRLSASGLPELMDFILETMKIAYSDEMNVEKVNALYSFFDSLPRDQASDMLYNALLSENIKIQQVKSLYRILKRLRLINYDKISLMLYSDSIRQKYGVYLIDLDKPFYSDNDIKFFETFSGDRLLEVIPETCEYGEERALIGAKRKYWKCKSCGSKNFSGPPCTCGNDKRGYDAKWPTVPSVQETINLRLKFLTNYEQN